MGGANKTAKIDYFTKNISPPRFFEINTSNFQEIYLAFFRKNFLKEFKEIKKQKFY